MIKGRSCLFSVRLCRTECCIRRMLRCSACIFKEFAVRCSYFVFVGGEYLYVLFPLSPCVFEG